MFNTPNKKNFNQITSLRQKIQNKLLTEKKNVAIKQNLFHNYQSTLKNINFRNQEKDIYKKKIDVMSLKPQGKENFNTFHTVQHDQLQPKITENIILDYESLKNKSFYGFQQWVEYNKKFFGHVSYDKVKILWKIMRIINYGDVWIPSGLIFQVSKVLTAKLNKQKFSLKQVFNEFLKFNNSTDQVNNFRQLKNLPSFQSIVNIYIKTESTIKDSSFKKKPHSSLKYLSQSTDVFERAYNDFKTRKQYKNRNAYKSLVQQHHFQECTFKPKINEYHPQKLYVEQNQQLIRVCCSKDKAKKQDISKFYETEALFKAIKFSKGVLENKNLHSIPGVVEYIDRKKLAETQKRKADKYIQKPALGFHFD